MNFKTDNNERKKKIQRCAGLETFFKPEICVQILALFSRHFLEWYINEEIDIV